MKVATLTFQNTTNFGASLQCYALHRSLQLLGVETEVIQYDGPYLNKPYKLAALKEKGLIRYILGNIWTLLRLPRSRKFKAFDKNIKFTRVVNEKTIDELESEFDLFITGSDQVWNGSLSAYDSNYFLSFVKDPEKKASYAASFGFLHVPEVRRDWYVTNLKNFRYYNVRETSGQKIVKELTGRDANLTIDPTLLLLSDEWMKVMANLRNNGPYILTYQITPCRKMTEVLKKLKKETGYKVVAIPFVMDFFLDYKSKPTVGPSEFLGLFNNAAYIVTDSFHGTAFSLIFNKNFWTLSSRRESRITSVLKIVGLDNRIIYFDEDIKNHDIQDEIDYAEANFKMEEYREKAIRSLKEMIDGK